ncbi:MAG: cardiolipin synthase [Gammaproteobacteria bacterium]
MATSKNLRRFSRRLSWHRVRCLVLPLLALLAGCAGPDLRIATPPPGDALPMVGRNGAVARREEHALLSRALKDGVARDGALVEALRRNLGHTTFTAGNEVSLLTDGPSTFESFARALADAHHHIHVETFIFSDDKLGHSFAALLAEKSRQGVEVRLLYDGLGSWDADPALFDQLRDAGVAVQAYRPLSLDAVGSVLNGDMNQRDHRKLLVVDGRIAFVGGINISGTYNSGSSLSPGAEPGLSDGWRDTQVRIEGPAAQQFQALFFATWAAAGGAPAPPAAEFFPPIAPRGTALVAAVASEPGASTEAAIHRCYLAAIEGARRRLWITQAYFAPDRALRRALREAAGRGVDVRVLLPGFSDSRMVLNASRAIYAGLLARGVRIFEFDQAFVHAKTAVVDDSVSLVGSANMDFRSLLDNNEVTALIVDASTAQRMAALFERDQARAKEIRAEDWQHRSLPQRLKEKGASLLWRWL